MTEGRSSTRGQPEPSDLYGCYNHIQNMDMVTQFLLVTCVYITHPGSHTIVDVVQIVGDKVTRATTEYPSDCQRRYT